MKENMVPTTKKNIKRRLGQDATARASAAEPSSERRAKPRDAEVNAFPRLAFSFARIAYAPRVLIALAFTVTGAAVAWLIAGKLAKLRLRGYVEPVRHMGAGDIDVAPAP